MEPSIKDIQSNSASLRKTSEVFNKEDWASAYCNIQEELTNFQLKVIRGEIPSDLAGTFYRNGPGRLERGGQWVHHPFDGDGMIASISFHQGQAKLTNRFVRTKAWLEEEKANKFLYRGVFGTQKPGGVIANAFDLRLKNIANTNVIKFGDQLLALWEAASPYSLDPETLETNGISNLNGVLKPNEAFSAHPRMDPGHHGASRIVNFGVKTGPKSAIRLLEFSAKGNSCKLISERKDNFNGFAFLHDFAITPNWAIFLQNAVSFKPLPFILGQKGAAQCLASQKNKIAKFWLIPRDCGSFSGKDPKVFDAPNGFVFHHLNASEKDENIILESIHYNDFPTIEKDENFKEINFEKLPEGILKRCIINLSSGKVSTEVLSRQCCEFAMVNPKLQGLSAKYSWMATAAKSIGNGPLQVIKKINLLNKDSLYWSAAPRGFVSEPIMVPNYASKHEDDGWILVLIWNGEIKANDLIILKAKDLNHQATLRLPIKIPYGLHGSWANCH